MPTLHDGLSGDSHYDAGRLVIFSLNPVGTVLPLEDDSADESARTLSTKKYLGWIDTHTTRSYYGKSTHKVSLFVVSQRPAIPTAKPILDEPSFVPIWPATHPLDRKPLQPCGVLPWSNCVQYCQPSVSFTVANEHKENSAAVTLTKEDVNRMYDEIGADRERLRLAKPAAGTSSMIDGAPQLTEELEWTVTDLPPASASSLSLALLQIDAQPAAEHEAGGYTHEKDTHDRLECDGETSDRDSNYKLVLEDLLRRVGRMPPKVDIWWDLSTAHEIGDPADLWKELDAIKGIERRAKEQMEAELKALAKRRAQKPEWMTKANEALRDELSDAVSTLTVADDFSSGVPQTDTSPVRGAKDVKIQPSHLRGKVADASRAFFRSVFRSLRRP